MRVVDGAFGAAVPAIVLVMVIAVAVILAVGMVVLLIVGNQVVEGETIMGGDKVDAPHWVPVELGKDAKTAADSIGQIGHGTQIAFDKWRTVSR